MPALWKTGRGLVVARRDNVTGIPMLSIGTTKNSKGHLLTRYCVNYKKNDCSPTSASFYFGQNKNQLDAYLEACSFIIELGFEIGSVSKQKRIFYKYKHESLI